MRVPLMKKEWTPAGHSEFKLPCKGTTLGFSRREVTVVVEPTLAGRDYKGISQQYTELVFCGVVEFCRAMWVYAGGGPQHARVCMRQREGSPRSLQRGPGHEQPAYT